MNVTFLTVIPSPYQQDLFAALAAAWEGRVRVLYYAHASIDRHWSQTNLAPHERVLDGRTLNWIGRSAHFNPSILRVLSESLNDVVVVSDYSAPTAQLAMRYLNHHRRTWVFWGELPGFSKRGRLGEWFRSRLQSPLRGCAAICAVGDRAVDAYNTLFPGKPVFNVPYFCDLRPFREATKRRGQKEGGKVELIYSGQMIHRKGVDVLLEAFAQAASDAPKLHLSLLGDGPELVAYKSMVPVQLRSHIRFLGHQEPERLPDIFANADIFCLPSRHDGWGVVVNEALGAGLPIIVSDRVGAADLVQDGVNGRVVPAGDPGLLAAALREIGTHDDVRRRFAEGSREASLRWGIDEGVRRWQDVIASVARKQ